MFRSPINEDLAEGDGARLRAARRPTTMGEKTSVYTRKAPYSFGWDWGPRFVTCGVWKPVRLEAWDEARIVDVAVRQKELGKEKATPHRRGRGRGREPAAGGRPARHVEVAVEGGGAPVTVKVPLKAGATTHTRGLRDRLSPRLWWPNGYGEQPLYTVKTRLLVDGPAVDERRTRIGLRALELRRAKDEWGTSFEFVVNGVPVFAKGANWIPADSFLTAGHARALRRAPRARRGRPHEHAARVGRRDLRERRLLRARRRDGPARLAGLPLLLQPLPGGRGLPRRTSRRRRRTAIRRLRNHPVDRALVRQQRDGGGLVLLGLEGATARRGSGTTTRRSSTTCCRGPSRGSTPPAATGRARRAPTSRRRRATAGNGDMHYWGVWHGPSPSRPTSGRSTRFMSEYGFQSFPEMKTIRVLRRGTTSRSTRR